MIQRLKRPDGTIRYKVRIKSHGRQIACQSFDRRSDAVAWEEEQHRRLRHGEWVDPRRGRAALNEVAAAWIDSLGSMKRRTREGYEADWRLHVQPKFGKMPVASITAAEVQAWMGNKIADGAAPSSASRYLATLRSVLAFAVADGRITTNVAASVKPPRGGHARRNGQALNIPQLMELHRACHGPYRDIVLVLALTGLRWGELAGLKVGDIVEVPGPGLRLQRAVLASGKGGELFVDSLKTHRARTVPLIAALQPIVRKWADGKSSEVWLFAAPLGGRLSEENWKRSVRWSAAKQAIGIPQLRVHDLRHTAASVWLASGADPKVVQRVLGHASAAMTMDLYGHLIDENLWSAGAALAASITGLDLPPSEENPTIAESGVQ